MSVSQSFQTLRQHGVIIDRETLVLMGLHAAQKIRGPAAEQPRLTVHWGKSFRRRFGVGKLRKPATDRPPLSSEDILSLNLWRKQYESIVKSPEMWGIPMPADWGGGIPEDLQVAADETLSIMCPTAEARMSLGQIPHALWLASPTSAKSQGPPAPPAVVR